MTELSASVIALVGQGGIAEVVIKLATLLVGEQFDAGINAGQIQFTPAWRQQIRVLRRGFG